MNEWNAKKILKPEKARTNRGNKLKINGKKS